MAQPDRPPVAPPRRVRANDWGPMGGPVLPGEFRPLAPTPASSESGGAPPFTEKQLLRMLVEHYRWGYVAPDLLRRYNPHGRNILQLVEGSDDV